MPKSKNTRNGKVRRHTNGTSGSHMNGKKVGTKFNRLMKLGV